MTRFSTPIRRGVAALALLALLAGAAPALVIYYQHSVQNCMGTKYSVNVN